MRGLFELLAGLGGALRGLRRPDRDLRQGRRRRVNSDFATLFRTVVILAVLAAIVAATGQWQAALDGLRPSLPLLVLSGLATGASWLCYFRALKLGDASRVAPVDKLSVILVAIFGVAFLGEHLARAQWLAIALIGLGVVLLARG